MINSDYNIGFRIDRNILFSILKDDYNFRVDYDPDRYSGLKVSYMYQPGNENKGICLCEKIKGEKRRGRGCKGKGTKGTCKNITTIIFQKGNILITGSNKAEILQIVYNEINTLLKKEYEKIVNYSIQDINDY